MAKRITLELPDRSYERLLWCQRKMEAPSMVSIIRAALLEYERRLRGAEDNSAVAENG